jgi:hypothetical protein
VHRRSAAVYPGALRGPYQSAAVELPVTGGTLYQCFRYVAAILTDQALVVHSRQRH